MCNFYFIFSFSKPLTGGLQISFLCDGGKCSTFDGGQLTPVILSAQQPNVSVNFTSIVAGHDVIELVMNAELPDTDLIRYCTKFCCRVVELKPDEFYFVLSCQPKQ